MVIGCHSQPGHTISGNVKIKVRRFLLTPLFNALIQQTSDEDEKSESFNGAIVSTSCRRATEWIRPYCVVPPPRPPSGALPPSTCRHFSTDLNNHATCNTEFVCRERQVCIPFAEDACGAATGATGAAGAAGLEVPNRLSKSVRLDLRLCSDSGAGIGAAF